MTRNVAAAALLLSLCTTAAPAMTDSLPPRVGPCTDTTIQEVTTRLVDAATNHPILDSGSAVTFASGGYQVSYDTVAAITQSRPGDKVTMCLVKIPEHCPPGDDRGRVYKTTNLRTRQSWTLPDSEHSCGGA